MDLKQEVSLSALKRGKAPAYPVKTSINLVDTQQQRGNLLAQLGLFTIALVLIGVFAKFAVVDPLAASAASSNEVSAAQARLDVLAAENADYAELNAQYDRYVVPGLSEEEQNLVDRDVVLNLLQQKVMGVGHLSSLRMEKNTATVTCLGADLNEVSALVESLESDQRVAHVTVSTAQGENDSSTSATIQIVFAGPLDVEGDGGSKEPAMARRSVLNRSFSTSEKVLMLVLAVLLVVACYYFLVVKNVADTIAANEDRLADIEISINAQEMLAADRARMKAELEALGEDGTLPVVAVYDNIRNELNELNALMGGATTYNLSFAQPTVEDKLVRREVTVSFTVPDYAAALDVVRKLENGTYRCEITDFSVIGDMLADGTVDSVDAVLTVTYLETTNGAATTAGLVEKAK